MSNIGALTTQIMAKIGLQPTVDVYTDDAQYISGVIIRAMQEAAEPLIDEFGDAAVHAGIIRIVMASIAASLTDKGLVYVGPIDQMDGGDDPWAKVPTN